MNRLLLLAILSSFIYSGKAQTEEHIAKYKCGHYHPTAYKSFSQNDMEKYDVKFYHLDIEASNTSTEITGNTKILATVGTQLLSTFAIDLNQEINVSKVLINNEEVTFNHTNDEITVPLANAISANSDFTAQVFYHRPATLNTDGIYNGIVDGWKSVTYTLSESFHARNWFACKQDLHDKADSVFVFITVNADLKAGSNGILTNITDVGNSKKRFEWKSYYPIDFYLISIAVADYKEYNSYAKPTEMNGDSILIQNYLYNNENYNDQKEGLGVTDELIELFSEKYSLYPFSKEKYGHCYAPLGGAMEHQTMTTTGSHAFYIIAHELGHQWFGDNVTCATWQDIWINEGFASYSEYLAFEFMFGPEYAADWLQNAQTYALEAKTGSIYVPFDEANDENRLFSWRLTYRKGLCLVHMIRKEINNDKLFFSTLQKFQKSFADSVATGEDFRDFISTKTGIDFTDFFDEWYYGEGYPTYTGLWNQDNNIVTINLEQTTTTETTPFFTNTIDFKISHSLGDTIIKLRPEKALQEFKLNFTPTITKIEIDPNNDILKDEDSRISTRLIEDQFTEFIYYPNPIQNQITIDFKTDKKYTLEVYNIQGKIVFTKQYSTSKNSINTQLWPAGMYTIKILNENNSLIKKIIKQ